MPAGTNQIAQWIRYDYAPDDVRGGAVPTGTVVAERVRVRIEPKSPTMALLEQGVETLKLFDCQLGYEAKLIQENDVLLVIEPQESTYVGKSFRVISAPQSSLRPNDPRNQLQVILRRWEQAHGRQP